jgi:Tyrosine phosphatase family
MIHRFQKITDGLYRGSAPSPKDVKHLKDKFGIKKIISLDEDTGNYIDRACKLLGIKHIMLPLNGKKGPLLNFLRQDLKKLLIDGGPTFFHCLHGKDRTGLLAALFKCKYMGMKPADAIKEAKSFGFGVGVDPKIVKLYEKIIKNCKPVADENNADIVSNQRDYKSDNRDSFLDEAHQGSFAPYLSETREYPYDFVYNPLNDQSQTRENYKKPIKEHSEEDVEDTENDLVPMVGVFNNDAGGRGFGPTENYGGFFYD